MADHAFFQYERTLQREATPELCIHLPARTQPAAEALSNGGADHAATESAQHANGDAAMAEAAPAEQNGGTLVPASGADTEASAMELDAGPAPQQGALDNGGAQPDGSAAAANGAAANGAAAGLHAGNDTARKAGLASANGAIVQHGGAAPAPLTAAAENTDEGGMRTVKLRIEYELAQPTAGLLFWGAYAQTDMQVGCARVVGALCALCTAGDRLCTLLVAWHARKHGCVALLRGRG